MDRKLSVILAADVVGYSAHMERDEAGTFSRISAGRKELFEPEIARHHGRVFKLMGDGMLAEFGSVVDAVECAVALQRGLAERNAEFPDADHIQVRIGINLGEVIVEGDDRYGEGVNIATRLEQLAEPGGIWVSGKVAKEVEKKLAFAFEPMGEQRVKNIAEPVPVFRVKLDGMPAKPMAPAALTRAWPWAAAIALAAILGAGALWVTPRFETPPPAPASAPTAVEGKPSLAVLPFANLSDDKEQGYLADGIADDLTTELARVPGLFVVSRNAALAYKGKAAPPAQIAKELGVRYVVGGSTRRAGDEMRINAQLIDTQTGGHIWAERFDGKWAEVFTLQDRIVGQIASALRLRLAQNQSDLAGGTRNAAAYDHYLRGQTLQQSGNPADWAKAIQNFEQALALDPDFGRAEAKLAWMYYSAQSVKSKQSALGISGDEARARGKAFFDKAAEHPSATYYQLLAENLLYQQRSDEAVVAAGRAIALDPSDPWGHEEMGFALILNGRPEDGRIYVDTANRLDPGTDAKWRALIAALAEFSMGRFEKAAALLEKIGAKTDADSYWDFWGTYNGLRLLIATYGHLGRDTAALKEKLKPFMADVQDDEFTVAIAMAEFPFEREADSVRVIEGLRKAGVSDLGERAKLGTNERLTGPQIKSLIFGHAAEGKQIASGDAYRRETAADGTSKVTVGSWSDTGTTTVEDNFLCSAAPTSNRGCGAVYRNPTGTPERRNEYLYIRPFNGFEFSVVK